MNIKLALVTVMYNSIEVLDDFFGSLAIQEYDNYILYIVDNSSDSAVLERAKVLAGMCKIKQVVFINNFGNNVGVAAANNQGIRAALKDDCEYVLILNNDLLFDDSKVLSNLVSLASRDEECLVTPLILSYPEKLLWFSHGYFNQYKALAPHVYVGEHVHEVFHNIPMYCDYAPTCFLLVHRSLFKSIGLMDESYFAYYDDTDFVFRAMRAGNRVRCAKHVTIFHKVSVSTGGGESYFGAYHLTRNRIFFAKRRLTFPKRQISILYTVATTLIKLLKTGQGVNAKKAMIIGLWHGCRDS